MPGEWAQQDLIQKSAILQTLYSKIYPMQISFRFLRTNDLEVFSQQCA